MPVPTEIIESLTKFGEKYPDSKQVGFVMMKFSDSKAHIEILDAVRQVFKYNGIELLRSDDFQFHPDLFTNILTYMNGCGLGVAIFDRIDSEDFNPNVSLEVGYMMALGKPVCFLKDKTLKTLQVDIIGRLYINFDPFNPYAGLYEEIQKWLLSNDLCQKCSTCSIEFCVDINDWETSSMDAITAGFRSFVSGQKPELKGIRKTDVGNTIFDFEGNEAFSKKLKESYDKGELDILSGIKVIGLTIQEKEKAPKVDYAIQNVGSESGEFLVQICLLARIEGWEDEAENAKKVLPNPTSDISKCAIYISREGGLHYFHSNYIIPGRLYPTKIVAKKFCGLKNILPLIIGDMQGNIFANDKILLNHIKSVRYIFNKNVTVDGSKQLPFDHFLASKREFVSI